MKEHFILSSYLKKSKTFSIYRDLFSLLSLKHCYMPVEIQTREQEQILGNESDSLNSFFLSFRNNPNAMSIVVSNPFKQVVPEFCDSLEPSARQMNAVNLIIKKNDELTGFNIDGEAFFNGQRETIGFNFENKTILFLGCGGVSTAVAFKLAHLGVKSVQLFDTSTKRKKTLANKLRLSFKNLSVIEVPQITNESIVQANIIYNGTGVGKESDNPNSVDESPLSQAITIPNGELAIDANYTPWKTKFLQQSEQAGLQTLNGFPHMIAFITLHLSQILDTELSFDAVKKIGERNL